MRRAARFLILGLVLVFSCVAGTTARRQAQLPEKPLAGQRVEINDIVEECQQRVRAPHYAGVVWWIPVEFWEASARQNNPDAPVNLDEFKPLRDYTMVAVFVGKVSPLGSLSYPPAADVRANTVLRDAEGIEYHPLESVSPDAQLLADVLRPIFSNALGQLGEKIEVLYFPARSKKGEPLADPRQRSKFSIVLRQIAGSGESIFEWELPLTSLSPPKFCPAGKERVKANWKYCPWHGVPLDGSPPAPAKKG